MLSIWDDEIDDLRSWDEVEGYLQESWDEVRDRPSGLRVMHDDELLVDEPRSATAKQRRLLHRAGFRRVPDEARSWSWTPPDPGPSGQAWVSQLPPRNQARVEARYREMARERARSEMALRVLRDVFGCAPEHLTLTVTREAEDDWEDEEDELLPGVDCQTLEAVLGQQRRPPS
jgi:hypothetical protein